MPKGKKKPPADSEEPENKPGEASEEELNDSDSEQESLRQSSGQAENSGVRGPLHGKETLAVTPPTRVDAARVNVERFGQVLPRETFRFFAQRDDPFRGRLPV
ncbi:MAG: hypothetical protein QF741_00250, partial [Candidatus Peribacteraceae bacterium]|nr:hypothetical protein [Candidatus Peribacteraceae bacterium]